MSKFAELDRKAKPVEMIPDKTKLEEAKENIIMEDKTNLRGINETLDVIRAVRKTGDILHDVTDINSTGGKKIALVEYPQFLPVIVSEYPKALGGISQVPYELADEITPDERTKIKDELVKSKYIQELILRGENIETIIDDHLRWAVESKNLLFKYYVSVKIPAPDPNL